MMSYSKKAGAAVVGIVCACFLLGQFSAGFAAGDRDAYLSSGVSVYGKGDRPDAKGNPLEDLNWLRNKAATEEIGRRTAETELRGVRVELETVKAEKLRLEDKVYDLEGKVAELEARPAATAATAAAHSGGAVTVPYALAQGYYEVQEGDSLWKIAARPEVFSNALKWSELYYANKDKISNPHVIYPGQVLAIPDYYIVPEISVSEVASPADGEKAGQ